MAANQTIIQAAKAAYKRHTPDISGTLQSMAAISKMVTDMADKAAKKANSLNKEFNSLKSLNNEGFKLYAIEKRNDKNLTQQEKLDIFKDIKNGANLYDEWKKKNSKLLEKGAKGMSGAMDPKTKMWLSSVIAGDFYGEAFDFDIDGDGIISDKEKNLSPIKIIDNKLKILNSNGDYVSIDELQDNFPEKSDSDDLYNGTLSEKAINKFKGNENDVPMYVQGVRNDMKNLLEVGGIESFAYDKAVVIDGKSQFFYEYYLDNYTISSDDVGLAEEIELYREGKMEVDDEIVTMTSDQKEEFSRNIFRSIIAEDAENINLEEKVLDFIQIASAEKLYGKLQKSKTIEEIMKELNITFD